MYAFFSASSLLLYLSCFFSPAVSFLLPPSCSFSLFYFRCFFSFFLSLYFSSFFCLASSLQVPGFWSFCCALYPLLCLFRFLSFASVSRFFSFSRFVFLLLASAFSLDLSRLSGFKALLSYKMLLSLAECQADCCVSGGKFFSTRSCIVCGRGFYNRCGTGS